jgi:hypothetical protein
VSIAAGETDDEQDFGYVGTAEVGDLVYYDIGGNNVLDAGDPGLPNVSVRLDLDLTGDGATNYSTTTMTDADGRYLFTGLPAGKVFITPLRPMGTSPTFDADGGQDGTSSTVLTGADTVLNQDFGFTGMGSVGDHIWLDMDGNGMKNNGEPGLSGVRVLLYVDLDNDGRSEFTRETFTDEYGRYRFTRLPGGTHTVAVDAATLPEGVEEQTWGAGGVLDLVFDIFLGSGTDLLDYDYAFTGNRILGDRVWMDLDGDGLQDAGEPGIPGVQVFLSMDLEPDGEPDYYALAATDSDGAYSFNRLPGGATSFTVQINQATLPEGLSPSWDIDGVVTPHTASGLTIGDDEARNDIDFGYTGTNSLGNRIWYDRNGNGLQDAGEPGIPGISVTLRGDFNRDGIADQRTRKTDADGRYLFSHLPEGTFRVEVEHGGLPGGMLPTWDMDGIHDSPHTVLAVTIRENQSEEGVDFGYIGTGAIGDMVWFDTNGDGVHDAGEPGIGGVRVCLEGDLDGDGSVDFSTSTDTLVDGTYGFEDLPSAAYRLYVDMTTAPPPAVGTTPQPMSIDLGPGEEYDLADFGLDVEYPASMIEGFVFDDVDRDGLFRGGELGIQGVTITLVNLDSGVLQQFTTETNGYYHFSELPAGRYQVQEADLPGMESTTANTRIVELAEEQSVRVDFGDRLTGTLALVGRFEVLQALDGGLLIEWETVSQVNTMGFFLYRWADDANDPVLVGGHMVPAPVGLSAGAVYQVLDTQAPANSEACYALVEVELDGTENVFGPVTCNVQPEGVFRGSAEEQAAGFVVRPRAGGVKTMMHPAMPAVFPSAAGTAEPRPAGSPAKILLQRDGLYYVAAEQLAAPMGFPVDEVRRLIASCSLQISAQGRQVSYLPAEDNGGFYFYGFGPASLTKAASAYLVRQGNGSAMPAREAAPVDNSGILMDTISTRLDFEEDREPVPSRFQDPEADVWIWKSVAPILGMDSRASLLMPLSDPVEDRTAELSVRLQGYALGQQTYCARAEINGRFVDQQSWTGPDPFIMKMEVPAGLLRNGENTLEIIGLTSGAEIPEVFLIDGFSIHYERYAQLSGAPLLAWTGQNAERVAVESALDAKMLALDITNPWRPVLLESEPPIAIGDSATTLFELQPGGRYLMIDERAVSRDTAVMPAAVTGLGSARNEADYLVITPRILESGATELAAYRQAQGLSTRVVVLEDLIDEFGDGSLGPDAIRGFLQAAYQNWKRRPLWIVLVGKGSFDYRNIRNQDGHLMPAALTPTPNGLFASDGWFADVSGSDSLPEMVVGRIPVRSNLELTRYIAKLRAYEAAGNASEGDYRKNALLVADNPDLGGNFFAASETAAEILDAGGFAIERIFLEPDQVAAMRRRLLDNLNIGTGLVHYIGHAGTDRLTQEGLLRMTDLGQLSDSGRPSVVLAWTCVANRFEIPGTLCLGESLVLRPEGGAVAVWAPTGISRNPEACALDRRFLQNLSEAAGQGMPLGEIILRSCEEFAEDGNPSYILRMYSLLGDPAIRMW